MMNLILAFIHIEKTAGTTIEYILRGSYGIRHCGVQPLGKKENVFQAFSPADLRFALKVHPAGLRSIAGHSVTTYTDLEEVTPIQYFTFLREPVKQCASYCQYLVDRHERVLDFKDWIQTEWPQNIQTKRIAGSPDAETAWQIIQEKNIFVGLLERFDDSLRLLKALFVPDLNICYRRRNTAPRQTLAQELLDNPKTLAMLQSATEEDQKLYQYVQLELFPSYEAQFSSKMGATLKATQFPARKENKMYLLANLIYRNVIYKPVSGLAQGNRTRK